MQPNSWFLEHTWIYDCCTSMYICIRNFKIALSFFPQFVQINILTFSRMSLQEITTNFHIINQTALTFKIRTRSSRVHYLVEWVDLPEICISQNGSRVWGWNNSTVSSFTTRLTFSCNYKIVWIVSKLSVQCFEDEQTTLISVSMLKYTVIDMRIMFVY